MEASVWLTEEEHLVPHGSLMLAFMCGQLWVQTGWLTWDTGCIDDRQLLAARHPDRNGFGQIEEWGEWVESCGDSFTV